MWGWLTGTTELKKKNEELENRRWKEEQQRKNTEANLSKEELLRKKTEARLEEEAKDRKAAQARADNWQNELVKVKENALRELQERQEKERQEKEAQQKRERELIKHQEAQLKSLKIKQREELKALERKFQEELRAKDEHLKVIEDEKKLLEVEKQEVINRKLKEPWRRFETDGGWTHEYHIRLLKDIEELRPHRKLHKARILFIGPVSAGKSSFINSAASIDKNKLVSPQDTGSSSKSLTKTLRQYVPKQLMNNLILMDTMGLEEQEEEGFNVHDIIHLIEGNVKPDYKFNPRCPIEESDPNFKRNPRFADKVHCVVIVMACPVIISESVTDSFKKKIQVILGHTRSSGVPVLVLITKIDAICEEVKTDVNTTYHSRAVETCLKKAVELFGVPKMNIFPIQNYSEEAELNENVNILIMLAIRKMMQSTIDRLEANDDQKYGESDFFKGVEKKNCAVS